MYHASTHPSIRIKALLGIVSLTAVALAGSACGSSPTGASVAAPRQVSSETFDFYFSEAEKRANLWFCGERVPGRTCPAMPVLPNPTDVLHRVRFIEEAPAGQTCYYNADSRTITVPADKWDSGCVPHEVLHATLDLIHNKCWRDIEHGPFDGTC